MNYPQLHWRAKLPPIEALQVPADEDEVGTEAFLVGHGFLAGWLMKWNADFMVTDTRGIEIEQHGEKVTAEPGEWIVRGPGGLWIIFSDEDFFEHFNPA